MVKEISKGSRIVRIDQVSDGSYNTRLYVDYGNIATLTSAKAKTLKGAIKQAEKMLNR